MFIFAALPRNLVPLTRLFQSVEGRLDVVRASAAVDNAMDTDDARYRELEEQYLTLLGDKLKRCAEEMLVTCVMYIREMKRVSQTSAADFCRAVRAALDEGGFTSKLQTDFANNLCEQDLLKELAC